MTSPNASVAPIASLRILAGALILAPLWIAVALWFVLDDGGLSTPDTWALAVVVAIGLGAAGAIAAVGYRSPAISASTPPTEAVRTGLEAFRIGTMTRFVLAEVPVLVALALAFVVTQGGFLLYAIGAAIGLVLMLAHVWPGDGVITRAQRALERDGGRVPLREALYGDPAAGATRYER